MAFSNHPNHQRAMARKARFLEYFATGMKVNEVLVQPDIGITYSAYQKWRQSDPQFAARVDQIRATGVDEQAGWHGGHAEFARLYFNMIYADFHLEWFSEIDHMSPGDILLMMCPPEHGKTTAFENYASEKLGTMPSWRCTVAGEDIKISRKIVRRVRQRMESEGPSPEYVRDFGPFRSPDRGSKQTWADSYFDVWKKRSFDERDYSMMAIGRRASIVSTRCDHLHLDDIQSTKTAGQTEAIVEWIRQDALTRPGETGITTIANTRVRHDDYMRVLMDDVELQTIMRVKRFPALRTDSLTGKVTGLWPQRYTMENYDRMRIKAGPAAWARNYMQQDGDDSKDRPFPDDVVDACLDPEISLGDPYAGEDSPDSARCGAPGICYIGVDPGLDTGYCVVMAIEVTMDHRLIIRALEERQGLARNEQIMDLLNEVVHFINRTGQVTDVVWETMNFQKGLARDERLAEMAQFHGFTNREHLTGNNKYDPDIGVSQMLETLKRHELVMPWGADHKTRDTIAQLRSQFKQWRPGMRGTKLRQDMLMALWFAWILWQQRYKKPTKSQNEHQGWKRQGSPWQRRRSGILVPVARR